MSSDDEIDAIIEQKAEAGVPREKFKKAMLPHIQSSNKSPEEIRERLGVLTNGAKAIKEIEGSGTAPIVKVRLAKAATDMMGKVLGSDGGEDAPTDANVANNTPIAELPNSGTLPSGGGSRVNLLQHDYSGSHYKFPSASIENS